MTKPDSGSIRGNLLGWPKLQKRFASYNPDVFQTQEDVDRLERMIEKEKAKLAKEKQSQN